MGIQDSSEDYKDRALKIHSVIKSNKDNADFRMGVPFQRYWNELAERLREGFFKKPLFKSNRSWVRKTVLDDSEAFAFLAPNIKIQLIVEGNLRYWDGWGFEITRDNDDPIDFLKDNLGPYLLDFILGQNVRLFEGVLQNL